MGSVDDVREGPAALSGGAREVPLGNSSNIFAD